MSKIYKVIGHKARKRNLNKEMYDFITEKYPDIQDDDMVEIEEYRILDLKNTWGENPYNVSQEVMDDIMCDIKVRIDHYRSLAKDDPLRDDIKKDVLELLKNSRAVSDPQEHYYEAVAYLTEYLKAINKEDNKRKR